MKEVPVKVTRNRLQIGLVIERHLRGHPLVRAKVRQLHRKDRTAVIVFDAGEAFEYSFSELSRHWHVYREEA